MLPALAAAEAPERVLFVGNSFSFYNNGLHNAYKALAESADSDVRTRLLTISGGRLHEHVEGLAALAPTENWDVIVLQGHSRGPLQKGPRFDASARKLVKIARANDAEPVLFMTWAYTSKPEMTAELAAAYAKVGRRLDVDVIPVGLAFELSLNNRPELQLVMADDKHPTRAGTYLAACVFYAALNAASPVGLTYTAELEPGDAQFLQRIAWETIKAFN